MSARGKPFGRRFVEELNKGKAVMLATVDEIFATDWVGQALARPSRDSRAKKGW